MESWLFLGVILLIAFLAKNQSLLIATIAILILKLIPASDRLLSVLNKQGINWGVTLISATILVPIATGDIVLKDLLNTLKSPLGWVATICGVLVAVLSAKGVGLINQSPEVTVALVFGTIMGVVFLKGIAAGPVIAAGITYCIMQVIQIVTAK
ncbi:DUF441 domain-containing protein [Enterococcus dongliensis]|uniref:UPF0756 membrane protein P7D36_00230 n=1 Tax=Enterococcus dongliensis TaxID=2559925 RepID=A0AAP5NGT9_9ENTE|nr:DUF441 domain-containing protein [Enterococcus dongliensis]MDT2595460.1 DUF441 domain-containing protein [Enterococcus dongliensis]MDT2603326.1 DUF441 domain-containing protein [Enterococcus dongliensis]MDT2612701.1 DUF441 domain-containing protein [Enterococcus dongliensis]MDT2633687.1 DUF441 domain-containing protein [Enterococcus dongliensis]MDT2635939.1 DUF441 domain-containing protein [Enterococcus dongliensis]